MRFLVTRPRPDCKRTADRLRALGHEADEMPLLHFRPCPPPSFDLSSIDALALTSRRAVDAITHHAQLTQLTSLPAFTVGDKTASACREAGFEDVRSADSDVAGLASLILSSAGSDLCKVLYLSAEQRSGDLGRLLEKGGVTCRTLPVYRMEPVQDLPKTVFARLANGDYAGVLVFSRRTGETLARLFAAHLPEHIFSDLPVYAISGQAAEGLQGFNDVHIASAPREDALFDLLLAEC
ncbi:uroporphyrinogen-III synthase [Roseibium alexandrii]|nr:uroporphyrinogen-III synthase [Roseibium alexandrii]